MMEQDLKALALEASRLTSKTERKVRRLIAAAEREFKNLNVIDTDDDVRGDMCSLILNTKPENMTEDQWLEELEARGAVKAKTMRRWLNMEVKVPQTMSCRNTLKAMGLKYYIGRWS